MPAAGLEPNRQSWAVLLSEARHTLNADFAAQVPSAPPPPPSLPPLLLPPPLYLSAACCHMDSAAPATGPDNLSWPTRSTELRWQSLRLHL